MIDTIENALREKLGEAVLGITVRSPRRVYVQVEKKNLYEAAQVLFQQLKARYATATGMQIDGGFELMHHFALDADNVMVTLQAKTGDSDPEFDSLTPLIDGSDYIERELHDLLGIGFKGHPNQEGRFILPEEWPEGVYPLRRKNANHGDAESTENARTE